MDNSRNGNIMENTPSDHIIRNKKMNSEPKKKDEEDDESPAGGKSSLLLLRRSGRRPKPRDFFYREVPIPAGARSEYKGKKWKGRIEEYEYVMDECRGQDQPGANWVEDTYEDRYKRNLMKIGYNIFQSHLKEHGWVWKRSTNKLLDFKFCPKSITAERAVDGITMFSTYEDIGRQFYQDGQTVSKILKRAATEMVKSSSSNNNNDSSNNMAHQERQGEMLSSSTFSSLVDANHDVVVECSTDLGESASACRCPIEKRQKPFSGGGIARHSHAVTKLAPIGNGNSGDDGSDSDDMNRKPPAVDKRRTEIETRPSTKLMVSKGESNSAATKSQVVDKGDFDEDDWDSDCYIIERNEAVTTNKKGRMVQTKQDRTKKRRRTHQGGPPKVSDHGIIPEIDNSEPSMALTAGTGKNSSRLLSASRSPANIGTATVISLLSDSEEEEGDCCNHTRAEVIPESTISSESGIFNSHARSNKKSDRKQSEYERCAELPTRPRETTNKKTYQEAQKQQEHVNKKQPPPSSSTSSSTTVLTTASQAVSRAQHNVKSEGSTSTTSASISTTSSQVASRVERHTIKSEGSVQKQSVTPSCRITTYSKNTILGRIEAIESKVGIDRVSDPQVTVTTPVQLLSQRQGQAATPPPYVRVAQLEEILLEPSIVQQQRSLVLIQRIRYLEENVFEESPT